MKLKDKVVFITGGTSGIGLESAKLFVSEGATVIVTGTTPANLENAQRVVGKDGLALNVDLRDPLQIKDAIQSVNEKFGRIDVVFANAGAGTASPLEAVTPEQIRQQFSLNFDGVFFTIQQAVPYLRKGSSIVVTTSFLNEVGTPGLSILSATKAALRSLVRSIGAEIAPRGIRINAVSPGPIATPFHSKLGLSEKELDAAGDAIEAAVPMKRFGEPLEVARAALFLASGDSSFMTGTEIVVDGGISQL